MRPCLPMLTSPLRFSAARSYSGASFLQYPHLHEYARQARSAEALREARQHDRIHQGATNAATVSFSEPRTAFLKFLPFSCFTCFELKMAASATWLTARALRSKVDVIFLRKSLN